MLTVRLHSQSRLPLPAAAGGVFAHGSRRANRQVAVRAARTVFDALDRAFDPGGLLLD